MRLPNFSLFYLAKFQAWKTGEGSEGDWLLAIAISEDSLDLANYAVKNGADVNSSLRGHPMLLFAASYDKMAILEFLLERGADIRAKDVDGETVLHHAAAKALLATLELLLEKGADIN